MAPDTGRRAKAGRYALAGAVCILGLALLVAAMLLWSPNLLPGQATPSPTLFLPTVTLTPTPLPPTATPLPTPAVLHPVLSGLSVEVDDAGSAVVFHLEAEVPPDRRVAEAVLWYDTEAGRGLRRTAGPLPPRISLSYRLDATQEGLTRTLTTTAELDYWWLVRDTAGESVRGGGTALLGPLLKSMAVAVPTDLPPVDFTWLVSSTQHVQFHYAPGDAAERDLSRLAVLAEASLARIQSVLGTAFDDQMGIYLIPRVFWQGGATYAGKVQLISYLDRNYTGVETWSYFTHEGTHALAQDLIQPKEEEGGPDGVLVEGLAVWASDGHYRLEPIDSWAAVVAGSDGYIPLSTLRAGPFYDFQHETSYLEAGSFVKYLVETYGLDKLKELYGLAVGRADHDDALVRKLYGKGYAELDAEWLAYLKGVNPTPAEAESWRLKVRSFDVMRRYETELDPDARILPDLSPADWAIDMFRIFLQRKRAPLNVVLETALIAAQDRLNGGDLAGAQALLDDVEAALDEGAIPDRPGLQSRLAILDLLATQDRAVRRADLEGFLDTLEPGALAAEAPENWLPLPWTAYRQELVRLDLADDGRSAEGMVLLDAQVADDTYAGDGRLLAVTFVLSQGGWRMASREPADPALPQPQFWQVSLRLPLGLPSGALPLASRPYSALCPAFR